MIHKMNELIYVVIIVLSIILLSLFFIFNASKVYEIVGKMKLTSSAFKDNGMIPSKYTCDGDNFNPQLSISEVPGNAESLVLIMDDPDAIKPAGKVWDHWIVFNIPSDLKEISESEEPEGIHGVGSGGNLDYRGPCPPDGEHKYFFKLYALDTILDLEEGVTKEEVEIAMQDHILEQTELTGRYNRV